MERDKGLNQVSDIAYEFTREAEISGELEFEAILETYPQYTRSLDSYIQSAKVAFKSPNSHYIIAKNPQGQVVAGGGLVVSRDIDYGVRGGLQAIYVRHEYRRKGIASKIVQLLLSKAEELGVDLMELATNINNQKAQNLYKIWIFTEDYFQMVLLRVWI